MILCMLASICLPSKIIIVDKWNSFVSFGSWLMLNMGVEPILTWSRSNWLLKLQVNLLNWLSLDFILGSNNSNLYSIWLCFHRHCFFHVIVGLLDTIKTWNFMLSHSILLFSNWWNVLDKTDHSLITLWIKFVIITCFELCELLNWLIFWVLGNIWFQCILEIWQKSYSVIKFNLEWLIINGWPSTCDMIIWAWSSSILAEDNFCLKLVHQFDLPDFIFLENELMITTYDL